jgi:hypothetical protein
LITATPARRENYRMTLLRHRPTVDQPMFR